jgi:hypothetical protein
LLVGPLGGADVPVAAAGVAATFFVSPSGDDANADATRSQPVRTLGRAQALVRSVNHAMTGDVRVELAGGMYPLSAPLALTARDSGTGGHHVIWAAASGVRPVVSGGVPVTGWTRTDATRNIWSAPVPAGLNTGQLYVNGTRDSRARGAAPVTLTWTTTGYTASGGAMSTSRNKGDLEFVYTKGLGTWTEIRWSIGRIAANGRITMGQPCWNNSNQRHIKTAWTPPRTANLVGPGRLGNPGPDPGGNGIPPRYVENAFELLDSPGEWYLDRPANTVHYIPRSGQNMATARVVAPVLETLVSGRGTTAAPIHHIVFDGLQQVGTGTFAPVTTTDPDTLRAYAVRNGSRLVLDNLQDPAGNGDRTVTVNLGSRFTHGDLVRLTGPSLATTSTSGIRHGGHFVGRDGTFAGTDKTPVTVNGSTLTLTLPPASATLVTLTPDPPPREST